MIKRSEIDYTTEFRLRDLLDKNKGFYVYGLYCDGELFYIGKGIGKRLTDHFKKSERYGHTIKQRKIDKAMLEGRTLESRILFSSLDEETAFTLEVWLIHLYGRINLNTGILTNLTDGGEGVRGQKINPESIAKMITSKRGKPGKPHTEEHKEYMREKYKGRVFTEEWKENLKRAKTCCLYCKKVISTNNFKTYHGEKCKLFN